MQKRILLIEDDEFIRDLYKRQLDLAGFSTDTASTGIEGIKKTEQSPFDLILLDIMLPDINGIEVLGKLKENEQTKQIPVIALSNVGLDEVMTEAKKLGAVKYLIKSLYTPDKIIDEVNVVLSKPEQITLHKPS